MLATRERRLQSDELCLTLGDAIPPRSAAAPVPLVDLRAQYATIRSEVDQAMSAVLERCDFVLGEAVDRFEASFAAYCEAPHAIGVDSGISALELIMRAWGIGPGDEVITAANSFIASASAISFTGATPVLVDVAPDTCLISLDAVARAITPRTRAVMPVHLYGQPVDMAPLMALADRHGLRVIEDACQAHGARYRGRRVGSLGHAAAFSFYPGKNLGACGDGGMVVTRDEGLAQKIRELRNYGQREKYRHVSLAYNRRLDSLQAAVLDVKLRHLDRWNTRRAQIAGYYRELLRDLPVQLPAVAPDVWHAYHLFVLQLDRRDRVLAALKQAGIGAGIHYPIPIHLQPAYAGLGRGPGSFPVAEATAGRLLSLPLYPEMSDEQIIRVAEAMRLAISDQRSAISDQRRPRHYL
jgi:dTDP-4-amino-4,6-dideoxygalactose transaminase